MKKQLKWYEHPLRISDFVPPAADIFEKMDVEEEFAARTELGFNAEHVEVNDVDVGESGIAFYNAPHDPVKRRDMLHTYVEQGKKHGKKIIAYYNVHWLAQCLTERHPDWSQRGADGQVIVSAYGSGSYCCVNTDYRRYALDAIRSMAQYPIDGMFLDGPIVYETGCFCEDCKQAFREQFGYDLVGEPEMGTQQWEDWFLFKRQSLADFMKDAREVLKSVRPEAVIYMNDPQLLPSRLCGRDNRMTGPFQDMLLAEGGFLFDELNQIPVWKPAASAMLLECQAEGKPYIIAIAGRQGPWARYFLSEQELRLAHWFSVAHGAWTWYGIYNECARSDQVLFMKKINAFLEKNKDSYTQTASVAKIALLWSPATANHHCASSEKTDFTKLHGTPEDSLENDMKRSFNGWFDLLSRIRQPFDIVDEYAAENGKLTNYELLVSPAAACLSHKCCEAIAAFVAAGGGLISTYDTGLYDETGKAYEAPSLAAVLGAASYHGARQNPYEQIEDDASPLLAGTGQHYLPCAHLGLLCQPAKGAKTAGRYRALQPARYCSLPEELEYPYIVENTYGKGRSIWFTANVDGFFAQYHLPEYKCLLQNAVNALVSPAVTLDTPDGIDSLHVSLRRQDGRLLLHIINYTTGMCRPADSILGLDGIVATLHNVRQSFPSGCPRARTLVSGQTLQAEWRGNDIVVKLPHVTDYEVLVLENENLMVA